MLRTPVSAEQLRAMGDAEKRRTEYLENLANYVYGRVLNIASNGVTSYRCATGFAAMNIENGIPADRERNMKELLTKLRPSFPGVFVDYNNNKTILEIEW